MVVQNPYLRCVRAHLPEAQAVYLVGPFNNWSTTRTPMIDLGDGRWETQLASPTAPESLRLFVWQHGDRFGRLVRFDARFDPLARAPSSQPAR
ncbi:MAG: hypothetical protein ACODAQ_03410 [Phycisphaeraceae bacterium]